MDLSTQTPVEIDTQIAAIYVRAYVARYETATQQRYLDDVETRLDQMEAGTYRYFFTPSDVERNRESVDRLRAKVADLQDIESAIWAEALPFNAEWARRGYWSRYFLVDNGSGHVHKTLECSTCFPTTEWVWLPEYSDQDEAGIVALAQSQACTVCFPSAPVTKAKGSIESPAKRKSRQEREEAKRVREEAKAAKAIANPDGSPLTVPDWNGRRETIKTAVAANNKMIGRAGDIASYGTHPDMENWRETVRLCAEALAARNGTTVEALLAEVNKKVAAKARREGWSVKATV